MKDHEHSALTVSFKILQYVRDGSEADQIAWTFFGVQTSHDECDQGLSALKAEKKKKINLDSSNWCKMLEPKNESVKQSAERCKEGMI